MSNKPKVKPLTWIEITGEHGIWWQAADPFGRLCHEATTLAERDAKEQRFQQEVLAQILDED